MIIVSQDRKQIINFENVTGIGIINNNVVITDNVLADEVCSIGTYKTEERAKEVMKSIYSFYEISKIYENCLTVEDQKSINEILKEYGIKRFVYEMPEE